LEECLKVCKDLDYPEFEIIVLPDEGFVLAQEGVKIVPTGKCLPAEKRDLALKYTNAEILDWLSQAVKDFNDEEIAGVGGPAITPKQDSFLQKASGLVYASFLVSASHRLRYVALDKKKFVDDCPSCNFLVRREIFQQAGGFDTKFWPGEDTLFCHKVTQDLKKKIVYDPGVLVYHHRRPLFKKHLNQVANYALHRGYFAKKGIKNSLKVAYFLPSIFVLCLVIGLALSIFPFMRFIYFLGLAFYLLCVFLFSLNKEIRFIPFIFLGIILTHLTYGVYFLKGFFSRKLKD